MAVAMVATVVNATKKTMLVMAMRTPISFTRDAFLKKLLPSTIGSPKSFTNKAPETLNLSVMV